MKVKRQRDKRKIKRVKWVDKRVGRKGKASKWVEKGRGVKDEDKCKKGKI